MARDAFGGEVVTWVDVSTVWAELDPWFLRDRLSLRRQQSEDDVERALILPFNPSTPSTRAERLLRLNARLVNEVREEKPTTTFLAALHRLEISDRSATLSDALSRLGFYVKTKR